MSETVPPAATGAPVRSTSGNSPATTPSAVFNAVPPAATGAPGAKAPDAPAPPTTAEPAAKNYSTDPKLYLYTSLTAGSSHIVTATSRMETILKANRIPFTGVDLATDEKARMLWGRRAGKDAQGRVRKLPGLVQEGLVIGDFVEIEDWNEYGELKQHVKIVGTRNLVGPAKPLLQKNQSASQLSGKSTTSTISGSRSTAPTAAPIAAQATKPSGSPAPAPKLAEEVKEKQNAAIGITSAMREMALEASQKAKGLKKKATEAAITTSSTAISVATTAATTVAGAASTATATAQQFLPEALGGKLEATNPEEKAAEKVEEELKNENITPGGEVKTEVKKDRSAVSVSAGSSTPSSSNLKTASTSDDALASKHVQISEPVKIEKRDKDGKNTTNLVDEKASAQTESGAWVPTDVNPPIRSHRGSEVEEAPREEIRRIERELAIAEGDEDDDEDVVDDNKKEEPVKEEKDEKKGDVEVKNEQLASSQSDEKENRKAEEVIEKVAGKEGKALQPKNDYASLYEL